jgi:SAM-dependent methyltransferase
MAFFSSSHYQVHNISRLQHLASLGLTLTGRVLEVGSGPGDHTGFYLERGCNVVSTDAREECIRELKERYPQVDVRRVDMNHPEPLAELGVFDIVHCYGLLYHLEEPELAIAAMSRVCGNLLLLETCVSPGPGNSINPVREVLGDYTQAMSGRGCRPTRAWVFDTLKKYLPFVYETKTQPHHPEFPVDWTSIPSDSGLVRVVFVASQRPLDLPVLSPVILDQQEHLPFASRIEVELRDAALEDMRLQVERANQRAALLETTAEERQQRAALLEAAAVERLALLEEAHRAAAQMRAEITAFRKQSFLRYLLYCWKNR